VFEKRAIGKRSSSVYRQSGWRRECFESAAGWQFGPAFGLVAQIGEGAGVGRADVFGQFASSVNRRKDPPPQPGTFEKVCWSLSFCRFNKTMLFNKDTPILLRVAAGAILAVATTLVLVPFVVLFFAVSPAPASEILHGLELPVTHRATGALMSLGAALDSSGLWRV
jgi:hypothetical protein